MDYKKPIHHLSIFFNSIKNYNIYKLKIEKFIKKISECSNTLKISSLPKITDANKIIIKHSK